MLILQRGTYRQSFRPIMWVYTPNEEAPVWNNALRVLFKLAQSIFDYTDDEAFLVGVGVGDHKESTKNIFKSHYPEAKFLQCATHLLRNARMKTQYFSGNKKEKEKQVAWYVAQVKPSLTFACSPLTFACSVLRSWGVYKRHLLSITTDL